MTARYRQPSLVQRQAMSATPLLVGSRGGEVLQQQVGRYVDYVVALKRRTARARSPMARIRFATRRRLTLQPSACKSSVMRGDSGACFQA